MAKQILKQEGAISKEPSPSSSTTEIAEESASPLADFPPEIENEGTPDKSENTKEKELEEQSATTEEAKEETYEEVPEGVSPEEVESLFKRLNDQNRLSVTDSGLSVTSTSSTETPSTVRAIASGDVPEDISKSQEDLLKEDNASVASGIPVLYFFYHFSFECKSKHRFNSTSPGGGLVSSNRWPFSEATFRLWPVHWTKKFNV